MIHFAKSLIRRILILLLSWLPERQLRDVVYQVISNKVKKIPAEDALRMLLELDTRFYYLEKKQAVEYGNGIHPKHRLMRYHDFFTKRIKPGEKVLDVGCGNGSVDYDIADKAGANVVGIDINPENIAQARRDFAQSNVKFLVRDALVELPDTEFEVVILSNFLEHLSDRPGFLRKLQQAVKPRRILIRVPIFERDWRVPLRKELELEWRLDIDHKIEYSLESFAEEIMESGLQIIHQEVRWGEIWAEATPSES